MFWWAGSCSFYEELIAKRAEYSGEVLLSDLLSCGSLDVTVVSHVHYWVFMRTKLLWFVITLWSTWPQCHWDITVQAPIEILCPMQKYIIFSRQDKCRTPYLHLFAAFWPRMCLPLSSHQRLGYFQNCKGFHKFTEKLWETNISCRQEPLSFKQRDIEDKDINKASTLLGILCEKSAEGGYQRNELEINQYSSKYSSKDIFIIYPI